MTKTDTIEVTYTQSFGLPDDIRLMFLEDYKGRRAALQKQIAALEAELRIVCRTLKQLDGEEIKQC